MKRGANRTPEWVELPDEELLDLRLCDLGLRIEGTPLEERLQALHQEFERAGFRHFRPYAWLSWDWFTPDGVTGFSIPFYLAHPRLVRLERRQMFHVEGGTRESCMKLLRHEAGHAVDNAWRLHRRRSWRETFGPWSTPYLSHYAPRPRSRDFVLNLDYWYAQSHPAEDWAETFAVWLRPGSRWRRAYAGWPALHKLEYVDGLMREIREAKPPVRTRERPDSLPRLRITLREFYRSKQRHYAEEGHRIHDRYLRRVFSEPGGQRRGETAAAFLRRNRQDLRRRIARLSGQHPYVVDQALHAMITRCRQLGLRRTGSRQDALIGSAILLTLVTRSFLSGSSPWYRR